MALSLQSLEEIQFLSQTFPVPVFSCEIFFVCRFEHPYSWFPFHFSFQMIVFLLIFESPSGPSN